MLDAQESHPAVNDPGFRYRSIMWHREDVRYFSHAIFKKLITICKKYNLEVEVVPVFRSMDVVLFNRA